MDAVTFQKVDVDGFKVFYREAGPTAAQAAVGPIDAAIVAPAKAFADRGLKMDGGEIKAV